MHGRIPMNFAFWLVCLLRLCEVDLVRTISDENAPQQRLVKAVLDETNQEESEAKESRYTGENLSFTLKDKLNQK